jgi:hypothetical protein
MIGVPEELFALFESIIGCKILKPLAMNDCVSIDWEKSFRCYGFPNNLLKFLAEK